MAMEKIELSAALQNLATQTNIDKVTGVYNGVPANIAKADLASVVAGVMGMNRKYVVNNNTPLTIDNKNQRYVLITRTSVSDYAAVIITPAEMVVVHNGLGAFLSLQYSKATGLTISTSTEGYSYGVAVVYFA